METGKDKIQKICDILKKETLDPAKQEAREIIENAHMQAAEVLKEAEKKARELREKGEKELEEKKRIFHSNLQLACRQGIELLKQKIEKELFDPQLSDLVLKEVGEEKVIAEIIQSLMRSLEEKGVDEEFVAVVPKHIAPRAINALLGKHILQRLKGESVVVGDLAGGAQICLKGRQITLDISDASLRELIAQYIRRDFREMIFNV